MRRVLLRLLFALGAWHVWRYVHRDSIIILTVHGVMRAEPGQRWRPLRERLDPGRLDECLAVLSRHYRFIPLADAVEIVEGRRPPQPYSIVLTFDDGYRNHVSRALPVLRRHGVPAVVYVSTGHAETRRPFWFDRLDYAIQTLTARTEVEAGGRTIAIDPASRARLAAGFASLRVAAKALERDDREMNRELESLAARFEAASGRALADLVDEDEWSATLGPAELRAASGALTFGSHTVDHLRVHRLPPDVALAQLQQSKEALESWTGSPCDAFCYPDGGVSADATARVREAGYRSATTTRRGLNYAGDDPLCLKRMDLPAHGDQYSLLASVSGFTDWLQERAGR